MSTTNVNFDKIFICIIIILMRCIDKGELHESSLNLQILRRILFGVGLKV